MATVTTTLTIKSDDAFSDVLDISLDDSYSITKDATLERTKMADSGADSTIYAAADYTRAMVYFKNVDGTTAIMVDFGSTLAMQIEPYEYALFPWDSSQNIVVRAEDSNTPVLEHAIFEF